jgi:hypothetical protein
MPLAIRTAITPSKPSGWSIYETSRSAFGQLGDLFYAERDLPQPGEYEQAPERSDAFTERLTSRHRCWRRDPTRLQVLLRLARA